MARRLRWLLVSIAVAAAAAWALRPVCRALPDEDLAALTPSIETRTDRDFYLTVFQQRDGGWVQCKTWLSRQFFF